MALKRVINPFIKINNDTGFGNTDDNGGRFINRDGSFNLRKEGRPVWDRYSLYQTMLSLPTWKFGCFILLFFIGANLLYTFIYLLIGTDQFQGILAVTEWQKFKEVYFFSTETFTTVGYGRVNPVGDGANLVASFEAMTGFLSFAIATGLIYGRFARPKAHLAFSDYAVVAPHNDMTALMFRFAAYKERNILTEVVVQVNVALLMEENGKRVYKFFDLPLERKRIESLPMNWTVVHPIDSNSPLLGLAEEDMKLADVEIYVMVRGFNELYSNTVLQRTSYTYDEIRFNRKFVPMYRESDNGRTTILELHKLNESRSVAVPD